MGDFLPIFVRHEIECQMWSEIPEVGELDKSDANVRKLMEENARLRSDIRQKEISYETRLNEADVELSSLKSQLTELMGVYDDLQVNKKHL